MRLWTRRTSGDADRRAAAPAAHDWSRPAPDAAPLDAPADNAFAASPLLPGQVVRPAEDLASIEGPDGILRAAETLGLGIVRAVDDAGRACVAWTGRPVETWQPRADLRPLAPNLRLVRVAHCDSHGHASAPQMRLAVLEAHWTVEILPTEVIRTRRDDGWGWTFAVNNATGDVISPWACPPDDGAAEALAVAELAREPRLAGALARLWRHLIPTRRPASHTPADLRT